MTSGVWLFFGMSFLCGAFISYKLTKSYYTYKIKKLTKNEI